MTKQQAEEFVQNNLNKTATQRCSMASFSIKYGDVILTDAGYEPTFVLMPLDTRSGLPIPVSFSDLNQFYTY